MNTLIKAIAAVVLAPIVMLVAGIGGCEATKAYYDWRVRQMCEKDGGATVIDRISIGPETLEKMKGVAGGALIPHESERKTEIPVYWRSDARTIRDGYLSVSRTELIAIRRSDGKVLGKAVYYGRTGGDFPFTASEPSHFQCPQAAELERKLFVVEGVTK
jgi:hypothetical protein